MCFVGVSGLVQWGRGLGSQWSEGQSERITMPPGFNKVSCLAVGLG
jgi:hypothetical protein